jgi:hypothetical protein
MRNRGDVSKLLARFGNCSVRFSKYNVINFQCSDIIEKVTTFMRNIAAIFRNVTALISNVATFMENIAAVIRNATTVF